MALISFVILSLLCGALAGEKGAFERILDVNQGRGKKAELKNTSAAIRMIQSRTRNITSEQVGLIFFFKLQSIPILAILT